MKKILVITAIIFAVGGIAYTQLMNSEPKPKDALAFFASKYGDGGNITIMKCNVSRDKNKPLCATTYTMQSGFNYTHVLQFQRDGFGWKTSW